MKINKRISFVLIGLFFCVNFFASKSYADEYRYQEERSKTYSDNSRARMADGSGMREDADGVLEKDEFEFISTNESITRSWCPYNCTARGIPRKNCRTWRSIQDPSKCYVQDLRLHSSAIEFR